MYSLRDIATFWRDQPSYSNRSRLIYGSSVGNRSNTICPGKVAIPTGEPWFNCLVTVPSRDEPRACACVRGYTMGGRCLPAGVPVLRLPERCASGSDPRHTSGIGAIRSNLDNQTLRQALEPELPDGGAR